MIKTLCWAIVFAIATCADGQNPRPNYQVTDELNIGAPGTWDYAVVDPESHLLYVTRGNHLQVIDPQSGTAIADIPKCGAHGVALVSDQNKGFTSDGDANTATAVNLDTNEVLYTIPTGKNPDAIIYDPASKKVFAFDGGSDDATVIDPAAPANLAVVAHIPLDGKPEFAVADGEGNLFVNIEDKNEIQEIDTKSMTIAHTWKIDGRGPTGLAIDIAHHRLFAACDSRMIIVDSTSGKMIGSTAIGDGVDACGFDPATNEVFASCGDGTLSIIKETSPGKFETVQLVQTMPGSRTMALDISTHTVYVPCAEFLPAKEGEKSPSVKPKTFSILVVTTSTPTTQPASK